MSETLLPCPFCGEDAGEVYRPEENPEKWSVYCDLCNSGVWMRYESKEEAVAAWNRRTPPPATAKYLEWIRSDRDVPAHEATRMIVDFLAEWPNSPSAETSIIATIVNAEANPRTPEQDPALDAAIGPEITVPARWAPDED